MENVPNKIIVHHTGDVTLGHQLDKVNEYHKSRKFPKSELGYFVGYHIFIEKSGVIVSTRLENEVGAHTIGENKSSIGVCLAGDFSIESPTQEQIDSLGGVLAYLCEVWEIHEERIYPHRKFADTECFGGRLPDDWAVNVLRYFRQKLIVSKANDVCEHLKELVTV